MRHPFVLFLSKCTSILLLIGLLAMVEAFFAGRLPLLGFLCLGLPCVVFTFQLLTSILKAGTAAKRRHTRPRQPQPQWARAASGSAFQNTALPTRPHAAKSTGRFPPAAA